MSVLGQKQLTSILAVAAVALVATVAVLVWQNSRAGTAAEPTVSSPMLSATDPAAIPPGMPAQAPSADFDPSTAPVVPADMTPLEYVTAYYEACANKEYERAFTMLPVATQQNYGAVDAFEQTLEGYRITDYSVDDPVEVDGGVSVVGWQVARGASIGYEWKFVEGDDGSLLVHSRVRAGSK